MYRQIPFVIALCAMDMVTRCFLVPGMLNVHSVCTRFQSVSRLHILKTVVTFAAGLVI